MLYKLCLFVLLGFPALYETLICASSIQVSGKIQSNAIWDVDTVIVIDTLVIVQGIKITVKPGTMILSFPRKKIVVNGSLIASGTDKDTVIFSTSSSWWNGIEFSNPGVSDSSVLSFCRIEKCKENYSIVISNYNTVKILSSTIQNNRGGGILYNSRSAEIKNNKIIKNRVDLDGAGLCISMDNVSSDAFAGNTISENKAGRCGGGIYLQGRGTFTIFNSVIADNSASIGGGIYSQMSAFFINNCTIVNNSGGGITGCNQDDEMPSLRQVSNTIVWGNSGVQVKENFRVIRVINSCIQGGLSAASLHTNILDKYPEFNDNNSKDYSLRGVSPCINMGKNDLWDIRKSPQDIAGKPRIYQGKYATIDIGAHEFQGEPAAPILSIFPPKSPSNSTQAGIKDTLTFLLVNDGADSLKIKNIHFLTTEYSVLNFQSLKKNLNFRETDTLKIVFLSKDTGIFKNVCTIEYNEKFEDLHLQHRVFRTTIGNDTVCGIWKKDNSTYLITGKAVIPKDSTLRIDPGVRIYFENNQSGLLVYGRLVAEGTKNDSIVFTNLYNRWNGICFTGPDPSPDSSILSYCRIDGGNGITMTNRSRLRIACSAVCHNFNMSGSGIVCDNASPLICNNNITGNGAEALGGPNFGVRLIGGGITCKNGSNAFIINNIISDNKLLARDEERFSYGSSYGGGIYCSMSNPIIVGNLIRNNIVQGYGPGGNACGGGIYADSCKPTIINNTIIDNKALWSGTNSFGGGIAALLFKPVIFNCIIWNNFPKQIVCYSAPSDSVFYSCVESGYPGTGNIGTDPLFLDPLNGNWELSPHSSCINTGIPDLSGLPIPKTDMLGNVRVIGNRIDMGAFESVNTSINKIKKIKDTAWVVTVTPNPATSKDKIVKIFCRKNDGEHLSITIFDPMGSVVFSAQKNENDTGAFGQNTMVFEWNKRNKAGNFVSSGAYVAIIKIISKDGTCHWYRTNIGIKL